MHNPTDFAKIRFEQMEAEAEETVYCIREEHFPELTLTQWIGVLLRVIFRIQIEAVTFEDIDDE